MGGLDEFVLLRECLYKYPNARDAFIELVKRDAALYAEAIMRAFENITEAVENTAYSEAFAILENRRNAEMAVLLSVLCLMRSGRLREIFDGSQLPVLAIPMRDSGERFVVGLVAARRPVEHIVEASKSGISLDMALGLQVA